MKGWKLSAYYVSNPDSARHNRYQDPCPQEFPRVGVEASMSGQRLYTQCFHHTVWPQGYLNLDVWGPALLWQNNRYEPASPFSLIEHVLCARPSEQDSHSPCGRHCQFPIHSPCGRHCQLPHCSGVHWPTANCQGLHLLAGGLLSSCIRPFCLWAWQAVGARK